jgi:hypothetical protein
MSRNGDRKTTRTKPKSALVTAILLSLLMGMTVTVRAQERRHFTPPEFSQPARGLSIHEIAQRYGIIEAIEFSLRLQQQEDDRREMERIKEAQRRDRELREKVAELAKTSLQLYQRFNNPSEIHADTPQLAKKCEELSKAVRRLLR